MKHPNLRVILGPPGTGKTTDCLGIIERELAAGTAPERLAFLTFTKQAAEEAKGRAAIKFGLKPEQLRYFRTIHSLVFHQLALRREQVFGYQHLRELGRNLGMHITGKQGEDGSTYGMSAADRMMFLEGLARVKQESLKDVFERAKEPEIDWWELERLGRAFRAYKHNKALYDYTDMLHEFVAGNRGTVPVFDCLIVDECQDLSISQWQVIEKIAAKAKRVYIAGDDDQCSVEGTKVATTAGQVPVEDLDPAVHKLLAYSMEDYCVYGKNKGYGFRIKETAHHGPVVTVTADGKQTSTTLNHRWIVRWTQQAKEARTHCVVYIMQRGEHFRVGWCQLFTANGTCHLGVRVRCENADHAWIVKVCETRGEASTLESVIAANYGLPTAPFMAVAASQHYTQDALDSIFARVPGQRLRAESCLRAHGRIPEFPIWSAVAARTRRAGSQLFVTHACNLLPDIMEVPSYTGTGTVWAPIGVTRSVKQCRVFGLDVDKHHTYIADGLVTHNCIFSWAGADVGTFLDIQDTATGAPRVLDQSYRVPGKIAQTAETIVQRIHRRAPKVWKPRAEQGAEHLIGSAEEADLSTGTWMLLARNGYNIEQLVDLCMRQGFTFNINGRKSLAEQPALAAVTAWTRLCRGLPVPVKDIRHVYQYRSCISDPHALDGMPAGQLLTMAELRASYGMVISQPEPPIWWQALDRISPQERDFFLAARRRGEKLTEKPRITISTIHSVKGGEADNVLLLTDISQRTQVEMEKDPDNEHRVFYVAVTRARQALYVVQPSTEWSYRI